MWPSSPTRAARTTICWPTSRASGCCERRERGPYMSETGTEHPLTAQAAALIELDRYDQAKELLARRLAGDPDDVRAWARLAVCHNHAEDFEDALHAAQEALRRAPEDFATHRIRSYALRRLGRADEAVAAAREAVRILPDHWAGYVTLSEALIGQREWSQMYEAAVTAVRLGPEETETHHGLWRAALVTGRQDVCDQAVREVLRLDPSNAWALQQVATRKAAAKDAKLPEVAQGYAQALAAAPGNEGLRKGLEGTLFRMVRGTRWLALLCLLIAVLTARVFPTEDDPTALPAPLGTRLYALVLMGVVWAVGAWRAYRKLPQGAKLGVWSLVRREFWVKVSLYEAVWSMLCAVLIVIVPWTDRLFLQVLTHAGWVPPLITIWFERAALREAR
ncbi:translation initiation factor IF-2 [Streptomyces himastatinicus ATCC 53653]|uniref:Translation initiation factor IF-2 n=2 Tax=Streptomyces violaceusniger group TaxID=2839105 RepID=D9WRR6_9ACTN|nr:translation initiation factor IF-2 [Streptomyces himastatinicus ATCC 53653]